MGWSRHRLLQLRLTDTAQIEMLCVVEVVLGEREWMCRWVCRSSSFLLPLVPEVMSQLFMGAVDDGSSAGFAWVYDGASVLEP